METCLSPFPGSGLTLAPSSCHSPVMQLFRMWSQAPACDSGQCSPQSTLVSSVVPYTPHPGSLHPLGYVIFSLDVGCQDIRQGSCCWSSLGLFCSL